MSRPSAASLAYPIASGRRLACPDEFPPGSAERKVFLDTVASVPPDHFQHCDLPTLVTYCATFVDWTAARAELKATGNVIEGRANPLIAIVRDTGRSINTLARSLRLLPISRVPLPAKMEPQSMSYYDRMRMEREDARD